MPLWNKVVNFASKIKAMQDFLYSLLAIINEMSPYILLGFFIAGLLHVFVPARTMTRHLSGRGLAPVIKAALFGIPLPLCSCGVLPTAVALRRQGASKGATTSFLIATPQTGVDSIAATYSLLGLPFAIIRPVAALVGAVAGGWAVDRGARGEADVAAIAEVAGSGSEKDSRSFLGKMGAAFTYGFVDMVSSVGRWLVVGLVVAALITVFVPDSIFISLGDYPLLAMLAVVVVAIPMYICATGSIPIAMSLMMKGLSPGIAFVMLMAGPAANFASLIILGRTQGRKATVIYVVSVVVTAIAFGLIIDLLLPRSWFLLGAAPAAACHHLQFELFPTICSAILVVLLCAAPVLSRHRSHSCCEHHNNADNNMSETITLKVSGMACPHCKKRVEEAASAVPGIETAIVDLGAATLTVTGTPDREALVRAVSMAGYDVEDPS